MPLAATVVVPTFDHGRTLEHSIGSILAQSVADIEVFVIGDGVPDVSREIARDFVRRDERVRFFDNPKGPRHGEVYRHAALAEARGRVVCYLADDDLFLPEHVERVIEGLEEADFTHALPLTILPTGEVQGWVVDMALPFYVELEVAGQNRIPLSCAAHTLEAYRRLPFGWRTTPRGIWTDLYMWQQFLRLPGLRFRSGTHPTVLHLASTERVGWSNEERVEELARWAKALAEPGFREEWYLDVIAFLARMAPRLEEQVDRWQRYGAGVDRALAARERDVEELLADLQRCQEERAAGDVRLADVLAQLEERRATVERLCGDVDQHVVVGNHLRHERDALVAQLAAVRETRTWRWRARVVRSQVLAPLVRAVARAPGGRAAR
jgi:GalNAc5-diNAcBac-PP-undecaprenol beta-1,3-glucosyltransferase